MHEEESRWKLWASLHNSSLLKFTSDKTTAVGKIQMLTVHDYLQEHLHYLWLGWHVPTLPQWYYGREPPPPASSWTNSCPDPVITGYLTPNGSTARANIGKSKVDYYLVGLPLTWQKKNWYILFQTFNSYTLANDNL